MVLRAVWFGGGPAGRHPGGWQCCPFGPQV